MGLRRYARKTCFKTAEWPDRSRCNWQNHGQPSAPRGTLGEFGTAPRKLTAGMAWSAPRGSRSENVFSAGPLKEAVQVTFFFWAPGPAWMGPPAPWGASSTFHRSWKRARARRGSAGARRIDGRAAPAAGREHELVSWPISPQHRPPGRLLAAPPGPPLFPPLHGRPGTRFSGRTAILALGAGA